jgi:hypothetical protein
MTTPVRKVTGTAMHGGSTYANPLVPNAGTQAQQDKSAHKEGFATWDELGRALPPER